MKIKVLLIGPVYVYVVAVAAVVSGVLSAITTAIITSICMWCAMKRGQRYFQSKTPNNELAPVEIDAVPVCEGHKSQTVSLQDNVAYERVLPVQQNVTYEQVHI